MRKVKVGFISPYEAMLPLIDELAVDQEDLDITRAVGNLEVGVALAREMEQDGADVLISRGGTAKLIREAVSLPVVDVHISGYDLLRSIMLAEGHSNERQALVGFPNITMGAASIVSLLELKLEVAVLSSATEVEDVLWQLKSRGVQQVLGDVVTIDAAAKLGLNGLLIQSGRETLLESFEEARRLYLYSEKNQQQLRGLQELIAVWQKDVLIATDSGEILFESYSTFQSAPVSKDALEDLQQRLLTEDGPLVKLFSEGNEPFFARGETFSDRGGVLVAWTFERCEVSGTISTKQPVQLPLIVSESESMKQVKVVAESGGAKSKTVVISGENGSGKQLLAEYMHVFHERKGLFVNVLMDELEQPWPKLQVPEQSTIVLVYRTKPNEEVARRAEDWVRAAGVATHLVIALPEASLGVWPQVLPIAMPPLRERTKDIPYLVSQFLTEFHQELGTQPVRLQGEAMAEVLDHRWPGNLTELKAYIKRLATTEKTYVIEKQAVKALPFEEPVGQSSLAFPLNPAHNLKEIERQIIEQVLKEENDNQTQAAKRLGINRATLWRKLKD